jgi:Rieske Fe-S protein
MRQFCLLAQLSASRPSFEVKEVTPCSASCTLTPSPTDPAPDWPGGYFCDCHGSKYDLAGRVFKEVPAPCKLPVPPHHFVNEKTLRVGDNPAGATFSIDSIMQV